MTDQALAKREAPETGLDRIKTYVLSPEVRERFTDMMGGNAIYYLNQVMILVANSRTLQECTPQSVLISAMRAASLRLSVDPIKGQAWIIPYKNRQGQYNASFQLGYKGVYELAMRTHQYRFINVVDIFEGEVIVENRMTGMHSIGGKRIGDKVIGLMLYFQMYDGFEKTFYMTIQEVEAHAAAYSRSYSEPSSPWNADKGRERLKMMRKTVLTNGLRKWGRFNEEDDEMLNNIEQDQGFISRLQAMPEENEVTMVDGMNAELQDKPSGPAPSEQRTMSDLGFEPEPAKPATPAPAPEPPATPAPAQAEQAAPGDYSSAVQAIVADIRAKMGLYTRMPAISEKQANMLAPILEAVFAPGDVEAKRHAALRAITGHTSLKEIDMSVKHDLWHYLKPYQDTGGEFKIAPASATQLTQLVAELDKQNQPALI